MSDLDRAALQALAGAYLERQAWYHASRQAAGVPRAARPALVSLEPLGELPAGMARLLLSAGSLHAQVLVGWREPTQVSAALGARQGALLGALRDGEQEVLAYDALADDELALRLLEVVTGGAERARRVRRVSSLASHSSLVYDDRLFCKCYRVLRPGTRAEVELLYRLDEVGFNAMAAPVARWRGDGFDLALVREFLPNALEGRELALTSLRDLLAHAAENHAAGGDDEVGEGGGAAGGGQAGGELAGGELAAPAEATVVQGTGEGRGGDSGELDGAQLAAPAANRVDAVTTGLPRPSEAALRRAADAGGDLAAELQRLGTTTAGLHLALVEAFGQGRLDDVELDRRLAGVGGLPAELRGRDLGMRIRLHGDYHLRRVMRAEPGWLIAGFGDDPLYTPATPSTEPATGSMPRREGTPLEDLADLCFSLREVALEALARRPAADRRSASDLAAAWVARNRAAFLSGYRSVSGAAALLPEEVLADALLALLQRQRVTMLSKR